MNMADGTKTCSSFRYGSDILLDYYCYVCEQNDVQQEAAHFCEKCEKCYCDSCTPIHNQTFKKHSLVGRGEMQRWPVAKATVDTLTQCLEHNNETITLFCEDHSKVCCLKCVTSNHRQCRSIELIVDLAKDSEEWGLDNVSEDIAAITSQFQSLQSDREANLQSLQLTYDKIRTELTSVRKQINDTLDKLELNTIKELDLLRASMYQAIQSDIETCTKKTAEMNRMNGIIHDIGQKDGSLCFVAKKQFSDKIVVSRALLKELTRIVNYSMQFDIRHDVLINLSRLTCLGELAPYKPNTVMDVCDKKLLSTNMENNNNKSSIRGICETTDEKLIVVDRENKQIKMFDNDMNVVCYCELSTFSYDLCQISAEEVAVTVDDDNIHCVEFYSIEQNTISRTKCMFLTERCRGVAYYMGVLYITTGTALNQYTTSGQLLSTLYEDKSADFTVYKIAVYGAKIYITNHSQNKLITLGLDGIPIMSFSELSSPTGIHVTTEGQVLVCDSKRIFHLDADGKVKATVATESDGINRPWCIYCNLSKKAIFVGLDNGLLRLNIS